MGGRNGGYRIEAGGMYGWRRMEVLDRDRGRKSGRRVAE
jgi:hypothetical protein